MSFDAPTLVGLKYFDDELPTEKVPDLFSPDSGVHRASGSAQAANDGDGEGEGENEDVWASKLLNQGETLASAGRLLEAIDMIGLVLTLEPRNDVARARLHHLAARLLARRESRGDETIQLDC